MFVDVGLMNLNISKVKFQVSVLKKNDVISRGTYYFVKSRTISSIAVTIRKGFFFKIISIYGIFQICNKKKLKIQYHLIISVH